MPKAISSSIRSRQKWYTSTVKKILTNEKYIGDALLQKTCTIDILNKTRVANNGIAPQECAGQPQRKKADVQLYALLFADGRLRQLR